MWWLFHDLQNLFLKKKQKYFTEKYVQEYLS